MCHPYQLLGSVAQDLVHSDVSKPSWEVTLLPPSTIFSLLSMPWPEESHERGEFPLFLDKAIEGQGQFHKCPGSCTLGVSQSTRAAVTEYHKQQNIYFSLSWRLRHLRSGHQQIPCLVRAHFLACRQPPSHCTLMRQTARALVPSSSYKHTNPYEGSTLML